MQAEGFAPRDRAWSEAEVGGTRYASRCLQVTPGSERLLSESDAESRWTVLSGRAVVHQADKVVILGVGASLSCPAGQSARITNPDGTVLVLSECRRAVAVPTIP